MAAFMAAFMAAVTGTATVCAAAPAVSDTVDAEWRRNAHRALADGVTAIGEPGVVGFVAVWGARALPVVVGRAGEAHLPIVGAGALGRGRVVAFAHDYGTMDAAQRFDTGRLLANAIRWAGEGASGPAPGATRRVGLLASDLAPLVPETGASSMVITDRRALADLLDGGRLDVLVCGLTDPDARERAAIRRFVEQGGGFLCFSCPWGWAQIHRRPVPDHPLNEILAPAGLVFTDGYAGATGAQRFLVGEGAPDPVDPVLHGGDALDLLTAGDAAHAGLSRAGARQAGRTLEHAAAALPAVDTVLRPRLQAILRERRADIVPTAARPLQRDQVLERALGAYAVGELERLPPERIRAHAAARDFPGEVPPAAPRVRRMVAVDPAIPDWQSTALYAAPGDQVVVHVREGRAPTGLSLRIGAHSDELWHLERWERVPRITQSWPMTGERLQVASPFGGLLYVEVPGQASGGALVLEIEGAVDAPHHGAVTPDASPAARDGCGRGPGDHPQGAAATGAHRHGPADLRRVHAQRLSDHDAPGRRGVHDGPGGPRRSRLGPVPRDRTQPPVRRLDLRRDRRGHGEPLHALHPGDGVRGGAVPDDAVTRFPDPTPAEDARPSRRNRRRVPAGRAAHPRPGPGRFL